MGGEEERRGAARDPGLQPERTRMAWRRTTLSCAVAVVLAWRQVLLTGEPTGLEVALVALLVLAGLAFLTAAHTRIRKLAAPPADGPPRTMGLRTALLAAGCTLVLVGLGAAITL
ncbi:hypothetical protein C3486_20310 [Streptomyces sp. Ru73]|uniref:DUF202 domain-containing protein n=1 Tax=Streptomyces sp. Ru73 TaxID=2080748 RepID=UPI000CDD71D7|nr:DUF202 domain-containing protein [Streptomyces sp. Ru73]POX39024.1 hypothetical protein C3486_20310 [Streptomyces sp. Ru73]